VFDDGNFSEYETVLLTDWMARTPHDVLAKNFGVSEQAMKQMPKREKFIFQAAVPGPLTGDQKAAAGSLGATPLDFAFRAGQQAVSKRTKGEKYESSIPASLKSPRQLRRRWSPFIPAAYANCTGIPMPTNGSITLRVQEE
jgi:hypothetical protein